MIETIVQDYLSGQLDVPVFMEIPEDPPAAFVVLRKTDSGRADWLFSALFTADSYADSLLAAAQLNERVKAAMDGLLQLPQISDVQPAGDYPLPDTTIKRYRCQAVTEIFHY